MSSELPKILIFDTETAPMKAYVWGRWKQNISLDETIAEWYMLCWSAKWLYSNTIMWDVLTPEEAVKQDDKRLVSNLWGLIDEADIVIAYNGKKADIPWMNTRFIVNGLQPTSPYQVVDPCEEARRLFHFSSNKLDALAGYFGIPHKMETNFSLWSKAVDGDKEALKYMSFYCGKDVLILEEVYLRLRPYIKAHPNINSFLNSKQPICASCGSDELKKIKKKFYYTSIGKYELYRCNRCGAITRGRVNLNSKVKATSIGH